MRIGPLLLLPLTSCLLCATPCLAADPPLGEKFLLEGKLADGETALAAAVKQNPRDAQARFGLGVVQFVRAVERMTQSFYRFGLQPDRAGGGIPFARLPVPNNPNPEPVTYADLRAIFEAWNHDVAKAEATLAGIDDAAVKLPLHFGQIRLDLDGDGKASDDELLWKIYSRLNSQANVSAENSREFLITFDRGDVAWLRGYCHLLMAMGDVYLAHDGRELFEHTAHLFFVKPKLPYAFLRPAEPGRRIGEDMGTIFDVVAMIHLIRLKPTEPAHMQSALDHLKQMIALSRESWKFYMAEDDDDHEWIPNPKQTGVIPGVKITDEMVRGWTRTFLDEADDLLEGRKLVPFWRDAGGKGVNLKKVFTEPRELDLVLWVQGTAAAPYLEQGELTTPAVWQRLQRIFRGEFLGFALWFN